VPGEAEKTMARLAQTSGLTDVQQDVLSTVRRFVDKEIIPAAQGSNTPTPISRRSCGAWRMGLFGLTIPEEYGGPGESLLTYASVVEELSRGWMSVSGGNTHFIVAYLLVRHGTPEQRERLLPQLATGAGRVALRDVALPTTGNLGFLAEAQFGRWFGERTVAQVAAALSGTAVLWDRYRGFTELVADPGMAADPLMSTLDQPGVGPHLAPVRR
jgi:alkylation response protein AidB-like acyl-CoA dehydrogenase